jgi:hypothetical protein
VTIPILRSHPPDEGLVPGASYLCLASGQWHACVALDERWLGFRFTLRREPADSGLFDAVLEIVEEENDGRRA